MRIYTFFSHCFFPPFLLSKKQKQKNTHIRPHTHTHTHTRTTHHNHPKQSSAHTHTHTSYIIYYREMKKGKLGKTNKSAF
mmetsp:Transcript_12221/g.18271  ORF Transcript_12221/g.18271 Transcript_12221/m.18271 type:complete len:80 (-) Transcript_12221:70-309(-)